MTRIIEAEPELQMQGGQAPPSIPARTAVGTADDEKPKCAMCGHKMTDHLGIICNGAPTMGMTRCPCTRYTPKKG